MFSWSVGTCWHTFLFNFQPANPQKKSMSKVMAWLAIQRLLLIYGYTSSQKSAINDHECQPMLPCTADHNQRWFASGRRSSKARPGDKEVKHGQTMSNACMLAPIWFGKVVSWCQLHHVTICYICINNGCPYAQLQHREPELGPVGPQDAATFGKIRSQRISADNFTSANYAHWRSNYKSLQSRPFVLSGVLRFQTLWPRRNCSLQNCTCDLESQAYVGPSCATACSHIECHPNSLTKGPQ